MVKRNFKWVADQMDRMTRYEAPLVVILMGSPSDADHCSKIGKYVEGLGLRYQTRVSSAHKTTEDVLQMVAEYMALEKKVMLVPLERTTIHMKLL